MAYEKFIKKMENFMDPTSTIVRGLMEKLFQNTTDRKKSTFQNILNSF